jgi:hypothetical protein
MGMGRRCGAALFVGGSRIGTEMSTHGIGSSGSDPSEFIHAALSRICLITSAWHAFAGGDGGILMVTNLLRRSVRSWHSADRYAGSNSQ